jgi:hypothetical protein
LAKECCGKKGQPITGSAGALARTAFPAFNPKFLDAATVSRFALIVGEGARVPSTRRLVADRIDFFGEAYLKIKLMMILSRSQSVTLVYFHCGSKQP